MKHLTIEITSRCNLSCSMCVRNSWKDDQGDLDLKVFRSLLSVFPRLDSLSLSGYGEPFLHPNLLEMIRTARELLPARSRIHLTSNGTLVDRNLVKEVVGAGLNGIALSMDSLEADAFESIRGGASLRSVTACLEDFAVLREGLPKDSFAIELSIVAMKRNIQELPRLIRFGADNHVDTLWVNNVLPHTETIAQEILYDRPSEHVLGLIGKTMERLRAMGLDQGSLRGLVTKVFSLKRGHGESVSDRSLSPEELLVLQLAQELASVNISMGSVYDTILRIMARDGTGFSHCLEIFEESREIAARRNLELHLPLLIPKAKRECDFIKKETCFVTWDGWVRPCNQLAHNYSCFHYGRLKTVKSVSFGKVPEEEIETIWNSQAYREFRERVLEFPFSPCGDCGLSDGCGYIDSDSDFLCDCNLYEQPCGDCLWSRGLLQCP